MAYLTETFTAWLHRVRNYRQKLSTFEQIGFVLLLLIPCVELITTFVPTLGRFGVILWIMLWLYIAIFTVQQAIALIRTSVRHRSPFALLAIGLFLYLLVTNIQSIYSINGENTQEITCALGQLQNSSDWGYRQSCLFGYPTRQFIVPALPSLLFGNSLPALNIGGAIYFILGLILFCRGVQTYVEDFRKGDALILLIVGSLLHFYYVNHFLFIFEQSIFPLSFALIGCGIWLMYLRTKSSTYLIPLTLVLYACAFSYTPSIVLIPLSYGAILWQTAEKNTHRFKMLGLAIVILTAIMVVCSFMFRSDIKLGHQYPGGAHTALEEIWLAIKHLALHVYPRSFASWTMTPIFIILLIAPSLGLFGRIPQLVTLWCIGVFCISVYAKGYTYYHIEFRMHRSIVLIPVLITLWVHLFNARRAHIPLALIILAAFGITISGIQNYKALQLSRPISQQYKFIQWFISQKISQHTTLYLLDAQTPKNNFLSIRDISQYFLPHLTINNSDTLPDDCTMTDMQGIFLVQETNRCSNAIRQQLLQDNTLTFIATYEKITAEPLLVFSHKLQP